jgi:hypothetical protein
MSVGHKFSNVLDVASLEDLFDAPLTADKSAVRFHRPLSDDFNALALCLQQSLSLQDGRMTTLGHGRLANLASIMQPAIADAAHVILNDMRSLGQCLTPPELRVIMSNGYPERDRRIVGRFHPDGPSRYMCAYTGPVTEGLRPEDAVEAGVYGGSILYDIKPGSVPICFSLGDLWKQAGRCGAPKPFLHRAPAMEPGQPPRLLLIADIA